MVAGSRILVKTLNFSCAQPRRALLVKESQVSCLQWRRKKESTTILTTFPDDAKHSEYTTRLNETEATVKSSPRPLTTDSPDSQERYRKGMCCKLNSRKLLNMQILLFLLNVNGRPELAISCVLSDQTRSYTNVSSMWLWALMGEMKDSHSVKSCTQVKELKRYPDAQAANDYSWSWKNRENFHQLLLICRQVYRKVWTT